jgi:hypothetical protein
MRPILKRAAAIFAGVLAAGTIVGTSTFGMAGTADAGTHDNTEICDALSGTGGNTPYYCLNAWNGGPYVQAYQAGTATNNNFFVQGVDRCNNGDYTTSGCPATGAGAGHFIYQIVYGNNTSECVGTVVDGNRDHPTGSMVLTGCNETGYPGTGGGTGTIYVAVNAGCAGQASNEGVNSYWTNEDGGEAASVLINDTNGAFVYNNDVNEGDCLGQWSD